jgi:hypothetical protein
MLKSQARSYKVRWLSPPSRWQHNNNRRLHTPDRGGQDQEKSQFANGLASLWVFASELGPWEGNFGLAGEAGIER